MNKKKIIEFEDQLSNLINSQCAEGESNTPDFILAKYMRKCLEAFNEASVEREKWYGKALTIQGVVEIPPSNILHS